MSARAILPFIFIFAAVLTLAPTSGLARVGFVVGIAPPAPVIETPPPPPPPPGNVWQGGYWAWDGTKYVWVPGVYVVAPYPGAVWVAGHWVRHGPGWVWVDGHWRRR
jgi:WXXGXW repeat (2 copies)